MAKVSIEEITLKLPDLTYNARKEIYDFLNFLLLRQKTKRKPKKEILLDISVWKEKDIEPIINAGRNLNKWNIARF